MPAFNLRLALVERKRSSDRPSLMAVLEVLDLVEAASFELSLCLTLRMTRRVNYRRVEVLTGPGLRRRWSADQKARIVAETLVPGARVSEVARRWQICSQQVFGWRRTMPRLDDAAGTDGDAPASFRS